MPKVTVFAGLSLAMMLAAGAANSQNYPAKPIRIYTSDVGGGADFSLRIIAQAISGPLGQQVLVDNRGGGVVAGEIVAHAQPDGYTLLYYGNSLWLVQFLRKSVPFDVAKDFTPITLSTSSPSVLVIHPSLPAKSVRALIALAKSKPGAINYASASDGTANHLAAELFKSMARVNLMHIPYKGNGQAVNAVLSGESQIMFPAAGSVGSQIKAGRLRALAVTGDKRTPAYPDLPTVAEAGVPGYEAVSLIGMFAPAKTPAAIINRINREVTAVLHLPDVKERFLNLGVDTVGSTPEQFAQRIEAEVKSMGKVIKDSGIGEK